MNFTEAERAIIRLLSSSTITLTFAPNGVSNKQVTAVLLSLQAQGIVYRDEKNRWRLVTDRPIPPGGDE